MWKIESKRRIRRISERDVYVSELVPKFSLNKHLKPEEVDTERGKTVEEELRIRLLGLKSGHQRVHLLITKDKVGRVGEWYTQFILGVPGSVY